MHIILMTLSEFREFQNQFKFGAWIKATSSVWIGPAFHETARNWAVSKLSVGDSSSFFFPEKKLYQ